ncbi:MAG: SAM-dependent methyltransferase, partial [Novosphingobium sp.]
MWLLDKLFRRMIRHGQLTVTDHDGKIYRYGDGSGSGELGALAIRLTDRGAAYHIAANPKTGAGEAYMDGRLVVEPPHDIRDFIQFATASARTQGVGLNPHGPVRRTADAIAAKLDQFNYKARAA